MTKLPLFIYMVLCSALLASCKKEKVAEYTFQSCNLESNNIQVLSNQHGTLSYTNKLGSSQLAEYSYYIIVSGQLPLKVCNMPLSISLSQDEERAVVFSGKMIILPSTSDAISTTLELSALNFD